MDDSTPTEPRARHVSLDSAYLDYINFARDEARTTFAYAHGNLINPQCNLQGHLDSGRTMSECPSTPDHDSNAVDSETPAVIWGDTPPSQGQPDPSPLPSPLPYPSEADNTWDNSEATGDFGLPPVGPKEPWGSHCGHEYAMTSTEYIGNAWRYDVLTNVEVYRVSTIPDDFIGTAPDNDWREELAEGYRRYKEVDLMSHELELATAELSDIYTESRDDLHKARYKAALRAGILRVEFLNKWPSAFELNEGTFGHWAWAFKLLGDAETARREGARIKMMWEEVARTQPPLSPPPPANDQPNGIDQPNGTDQPNVPDQSNGTDQPNFPDQPNFTIYVTIDQPPRTKPYIPLAVRFAEPDFRDTPVNAAAHLGKPVFALSPQQYEAMQIANNYYKEDLRRRLNEDSELDRYNRWVWTIERLPWAGYPNLPKLKPELEGNYKPDTPSMRCSEGTRRLLAGYWPDEGPRFGSRLLPKC